MSMDPNERELTQNIVDQQVRQSLGRQREIQISVIACGLISMELSG